jgi:hypothetical protein
MVVHVKTKKSKKECIYEAINELGSDATFLEVKSWVQKNYGATITDPPFYSARTKYRKTKAEEAAKEAANGVAQAEKQKEQILDLVKVAKSLVEKLGKENAKALIDCL